MYIGSIGEPSTLNPVQAADAASGAVTGVIFNGLLKYDAGLEIVGDLAAAWQLGQRSTFFFDSAEEAILAAANLEAGVVDREALHLQRYAVEGERLELELSLPGVSDSRALAAKFGVTPLPVRTLSVMAPKPLEDALTRFARRRCPCVSCGSGAVAIWANLFFSVTKRRRASVCESGWPSDSGRRGWSSSRC